MPDENTPSSVPEPGPEPTSGSRAPPAPFYSGWVEVHCLECGQLYRRKPDVSLLVKCPTCHKKRKLSFTDSEHAEAYRIDAWPGPGAVALPSNEKGEPIVARVVKRERTKPVGTALAAPASPSVQGLLAPEHLKVMAQLPFKLIAMASGFEGWNLTEEEAKRLAEDPIIKRVAEKHLGSVLGQYPDEYAVLLMFALVVSGKAKQYLDWRGGQARAKEAEKKELERASGAVEKPKEEVHKDGG